MTELEFDARIRRELILRYWPLGTVENNKTGYRGSHHAPFGGPGSEDAIMRLDGLYIAIEFKSLTGSLASDQRVRRENITRTGCLYVACKQLGASEDDFRDALNLLCSAIEDHYIAKFGTKRFVAMKAHCMREQSRTQLNRPKKARANA